MALCIRLIFDLRRHEGRCRHARNKNIAYWLVLCDAKLMAFNNALVMHRQAFRRQRNAHKADEWQCRGAIRILLGVRQHVSLFK